MRLFGRRMWVSIAQASWYDRRMYSRQRGSTAVTIVIIAAITLFIVFGLIIWGIVQSGAQQKTGQQSAAQTNSATSTEAPVSTDGDTLELADWGVTFTIPEFLQDTKVKYRKLQVNGGEVYVFTTERIESLGGECAKTSTADNIGPDAVYRFGSIKNLPASGVPLNQKPINGYYFVYSIGSVYCSTIHDKGLPPADTEVYDRTSLKEMIKSIAPIK